jgi:cold shock CspA family protein
MLGLGRPPPELDFLSPPDVFDVERALDITRSVTVPFADVRPLDNLAACARLLPGAAARPARPPSAAARAAAIAAAAASGQKRPRSESPPAEGPPPAPRHRGTVRLWDVEKGYGFICPADGGQDLFCHRSAIEDGDALGEGFAVADAAHACLPKHPRRSLTRRLAPHSKVGFERVFDSERRPRAERVRGGIGERRGSLQPRAPQPHLGFILELGTGGTRLSCRRACPSAPRRCSLLGRDGRSRRRRRNQAQAQSSSRRASSSAAAAAVAAG